MHSWPPLHRLLVASDGTRTSSGALGYAAALARPSEALLHLIQAWSPSSGGLDSLAAGLPGTGLRQEDAQALLNADTRTLTALGVPPYRTSLVRGWPTTAITEAARSWGAELVILGSHRRGALGRLALGTVSEGVVLQLDRPALVVHPSAQAGACERVAVLTEARPRCDAPDPTVLWGARLAEAMGVPALLVAVPSAHGASVTPAYLERQCALVGEHSLVSVTGLQLARLPHIGHWSGESSTVVAARRASLTRAKRRLGPWLDQLLHATRAPVLVVPEL